MATPPSDESRLLFKLLVDRNWHKYLEVRDAIATTVPPGRALRKYHTDLQAYARKAGKSVPNYEGTKTEDEKIAIGKVTLAQVAISGWKRTGVLLMRGESKGREIKVRGGWTSTVFPGYEPDLEPDPEETAGGYTDPPSDDSEPPEAVRLRAEQGRGLSQGVLRDAVIRRLESGDWAARMAEWPADQPPETLHVQRTGERDWQVVDPPVGAEDFVNTASPEGGVFAPVGSPVRCDLCGLAVGNKAVHEKWHEEQTQPDTPSEMALLDESQLRLVVRSEVATLLDQFQVGMQDHIDRGFAQLEGRISALQRQREKWIRSNG